MLDAQTNTTKTTSGSARERNRGVRILARSIFKELTSQGYDSRQIVSLATELISEVTADLQAHPE